MSAVPVPPAQLKLCPQSVVDPPSPSVDPAIVNALAQLDQRLGRIEEVMALLRFPMPPPLLKLSDATKVLNVSEASVRRWIERGELRAKTLDLGHRKVYRIKPADLESFVNAEPPSCPSPHPTVSSCEMIEIPDRGM